MSERKSLAELAVELTEAAVEYQGRRILHVITGDYYRITGLHYRESDMALCVQYSPQGEFYTAVVFARSIEDMDFGKRFVLE